jgi:hypothetical protein
MKSLQESLFDNNIKKGITIRQAYCLLAGHERIQTVGMPIGQMFMVNKLSKYPNPYYEGHMGDGLVGLLGIITDLPVPLEKDYNLGIECDWGQNAKKVLGKYIRRSWKQEFDENFEVNVRESCLGKNMIEIRLELYNETHSYVIGSYQFTFKLN